MKIIVVHLFLFVLLMSSCNSVNVFYDYDETIKYNHYYSFNFYPHNSTGLSHQDMDSIMDAVETKLDKKGLKSVENAKLSIDFFVNYYDEFTEELVEVLPNYKEKNQLTPIDYFIVLTIDIADAKTEELIWQGVAEKLISYALVLTEENREAIFQRLVKEILLNYPSEVDTT